LVSTDCLPEVLSFDRIETVSSLWNDRDFLQGGHGINVWRTSFEAKEMKAISRGFGWDKPMDSGRRSFFKGNVPRRVKEGNL